MGKGIVDFLLRAKRATYAGNGPRNAPSRPGSHDLSYGESSFLYIDTYLGGEQFAGEEAMWKDGIPIWAMNYSGRVTGANFSRDFHICVLPEGTEDRPFRGPPRYEHGDYCYESTVQGDLCWFGGHEEIYFKGTKIYECVFHGGEIVQEKQFQRGANLPKKQVGLGSPAWQNSGVHHPGMMDRTS